MKKLFSFFESRRSIENSILERVHLENIRQKELKEEENKKIAIFSLEEFIGKPVIYVSNEMSNVKVGIGKEIVFITKAKNPILLVEDIVTKEEVLPLGKIFAYTEQKFNALNKLEPNERIAIIYNIEDYHIVDKSPTKTEDIIDNKEWASIIKSKLKV